MPEVLVELERPAVIINPLAARTLRTFASSCSSRLDAGLGWVCARPGCADERKHKITKTNVERASQATVYPYLPHFNVVMALFHSFSYLSQTRSTDGFGSSFETNLGSSMLHASDYPWMVVLHHVSWFAPLPTDLDKFLP